MAVEDIKGAVLVIKPSRAATSLRDRGKSRDRVLAHGSDVVADQADVHSSSALLNTSHSHTSQSLDPRARLFFLLTLFSRLSVPCTRLLGPRTMAARPGNEPYPAAQAFDEKMMKVSDIHTIRCVSLQLRPLTDQLLAGR
jgi:hypothetical protein